MVIERSEFLYDLSRWKEVYLHNSESDVVDSLNLNGVHQVNSDKNPLFFFTENITDDENYILVGFSGAVTERKNKHAPFFSFLNVARETKLGLLAISDPSLNLSKDLNLAWYLGNFINVDLTCRLASMLDLVVEKTNKRLILSGGSGGGFAALNIHNKMKKKHMAKCFVWNPQTDATCYNDSALSRYFNTCYANDGVIKQDVESIRDFFNGKNIPYKVQKDKSLNQLVFINGYDPNHIRKHVSRFYPIDNMDNNLIYFGDWGYGHVQPNLPTIKKVILSISKGLEFGDIVNKLEQPRKKLLDFKKHKDEVSEKITVRAVIANEGAKKIINLRCNIVDFFMGFQLKFSILDKNGGLVYCSEYLLGANKGEVFISDKNNNLKRLKDSTVRVHIEDFKSSSQSLSFKFSEVKESYSCIDVFFD